MVFVIIYATGIDIMAILHKRLQLANSENIKMLDGMHEGLLVLNKPRLSNKTGTWRPHSVAFCNKPAQKLINSFIGRGIEEKTAASFTKIFKHESFAPLKKEESKPSFEHGESISLE